MKVNSFFHSDLKVVLVINAPDNLERFTFFLLGLSDLDDLPFSNFVLSIFQKIRICLKMLKNKANYKLILLEHKKEKNYQEIIKIDITKLFI